MCDNCFQLNVYNKHMFSLVILWFLLQIFFLMFLFRIGSLHLDGCPHGIWPQGCETFTSVKKNPGAMKLQCGIKRIGRQLRSCDF